MFFMLKFLTVIYVNSVFISMKKILLTLCLLQLLACENKNEKTDIVLETQAVVSKQNKTENINSNNNVTENNFLLSTSEINDNNDQKNIYVIQEDLQPQQANQYNDLALKVAGISAEKNFSENIFYKGYAESIEKGWRQLTAESLSKISPWIKQNIDPKVGPIEAVFYPFGGPDVTYAMEFFPQTSKYIIVGLEKMGDFNKINNNFKSVNVIPHLQKAMNSFLKKGYFITSEMLVDFSEGGLLGGAMPTVLLQLAKMNCKILDIQKISIDENGKEAAYNKELLNCTKIKFEKDNEEKEIYYIRMDLHDSNPYCKWLMKFVGNYDFCTLIKSSSYKFHDYTLTNMRNFVINKTQFILQDDTGVPIAYLGKEWNKYPFGKYKNPTLKCFQTYKQQSLETLYEKSDYIEIPFKIGYGYTLANPNLLLAIPKIGRSKYSKAIVEDIEATKESLSSSECESCKSDTVIVN